MKCKICNTENEDGAKLCKSCGSPLEPAAGTVTKRQGNPRILMIIGSLVVLIVAAFVIYNYFVMDSSRKVRVDNKRNRTDGIRPGSNKDATTPEFNRNPADQVQEFLYDLGDRNYTAAYSRQQNPSWGSFEQFSSKKSFGGINGISIDDIILNYENDNEASVYVDYVAYDPVNKDGRYKQDFILNKIGQDWKIVKVNNIKIEQW